MNRGQIRTEVENRLNAAADNFYTAAVLNGFINSVIQWTSTLRDWPWLDTTATFTTTANVGSYTLGTVAPNWLRGGALTVANIPYEIVDIRDIRQYDAAVDWRYPNPYMFAVWNGALHLRPTPVSAVEATFDYTRTEPILEADTDTPLIPERFHYGVAEGAAQLALARAGNEPEAQLSERLLQSWWVKAMFDEVRRTRGTKQVRVRPGSWL